MRCRGRPFSERKKIVDTLPCIFGIGDVYVLYWHHFLLGQKFNCLKELQSLLDFADLGWHRHTLRLVCVNI